MPTVIIRDFPTRLTINIVDSTINFRQGGIWVERLKNRINLLLPPYNMYQRCPYKVRLIFMDFHVVLKTFSLFLSMGLASEA